MGAERKKVLLERRRGQSEEISGEEERAERGDERRGGEGRARG